ncbi:MAG TPA: lipase family protein [Verrucomicrobiae bacterium]|nr:lipase family protein [Verrucomicrobiae bacterium]
MNLTATTFDLVNARECAAASAAAYSARPTVSNQVTDTQALVIEQAGCVIIAFRGTSNARDFVTDAKFFRELLVEEANGDRCEVHRGFLAAYESIIADLGHHLSCIVAGSRPVYITGHSLGGALAILVALELKRQGFNIAQVYTFGQPRVGNAAFKRLYDFSLGASTFRVVYQEDIVARVPHLPSVTDPYRHVGLEIFLPSFGGLIAAPSFVRLLASDAWGIYRAFIISKFTGAMDPIHDHKMVNYTTALADSQLSTPRLST